MTALWPPLTPQEVEHLKRFPMADEPPQTGDRYTVPGGLIVRLCRRGDHANLLPGCWAFFPTRPPLS